MCVCVMLPQQGWSRLQAGFVTCWRHSWRFVPLMHLSCPGILPRTWLCYLTHILHKGFKGTHVAGINKRTLDWKDGYNNVGE